MKVRFYDSVQDEKLRFAVIAVWLSLIHIYQQSLPLFFYKNHTVLLFSFSESAPYSMTCKAAMSVYDTFSKK